MFTQDEASAAVTAVALYTNRNEENFAVLYGDVNHGLILLGADISATGEVGTCYVYSVNTKRVYAVSAIEDPETMLAVVAERDAAV